MITVYLSDSSSTIFENASVVGFNNGTVIATITMPAFGRAFNCGRMWRATIQMCHFEFVKPFYQTNDDFDCTLTITVNI